MNKDILTEFNIAIHKVMRSIEKGEEIQGQFIFNTEVKPKYGDLIDNEPLSFAVPFWVALNEYLNSENIRIHGLDTATKEYILNEYEEYQENLKKVRDKNI